MSLINTDKLFSYFIYDPNKAFTFLSPFFLLLFTAFLSIYVLVYKNHYAKILYVTAFSLFFYYKSSGLYFSLLLASAVVDFSLAHWLNATKTSWKRKSILALSVLVNLSLLGYFKYTNFFLSTIAQLNQTEFAALKIFLPVGVSFFTFQSISYIIDIYRDEIKPLTNFLEYIFFISFFPQLVAGPIVRAKDFIPQIKQTPFVSDESLSKALFLIICGVVKKAIISDYISINFVDRVFDNPTLYTGLENLLAVYGYAIQIYADFSGYTDIAIGVALLMGFRLPVNFNAPYVSSSITEFWRRWHISLSTWLKDYLYIPLGGNRNGKIRQYFNLFTTMLLGGLWHGASFNFILWGALHGIALGIDKYIKDTFAIKSNKWTSLLGILFTFHFVCFCWILFRAKTFADVQLVLIQIFQHFHPEIFIQFVTGYKVVFMLMISAMIIHFVPFTWHVKIEKLLESTPIYLKSLVLVLIIYIVAQVQSSDLQPFIYFQF